MLVEIMEPVVVVDRSFMVWSVYVCVCLFIN